jgi:hypothetical protein
MPNKPPVKTGMMNKKLAGIPGKWWILGGAGTAGIIFYSYRKSAATAAASPALAADNTANAQQDAIDPNTGVPYADDAMYADTSQDYGSAGFVGAQEQGQGFDPATGLSYDTELQEALAAAQAGTTGSGAGGSTTTPKSPAPKANNSHWLSATAAALEKQGYHRGAVELALGKYLLGQPLTAHQMGIVESGIGIEGKPPHHVPAPHQVPKHPAKKATPPRKKVTKRVTLHGTKAHV